MPTHHHRYYCCAVFYAFSQESDLKKTPGRPAVTTLVDYQGFCGFSAATASSDDTSQEEEDEEEEEEEGEEKEEGFQRVSPQAVVARMEAGWAPFVLDVR